jgi:hypothetical protein
MKKTPRRIKARDYKLLADTLHVGGPGVHTPSKHAKGRTKKRRRK